MSIDLIPAPSALPTEQADYEKQNDLIATNFFQTQKPIWDDSGNIKKGNVFQLGGAVYYTSSDTAIGGAASDYVKLTPSGGGAPQVNLTPTYVANLGGVTWNDAYNGYYDGSGNLHVFDELKALDAGEISVLYTRLWNAMRTMLGLRKGLLEVALTNYTTTGVPQIAAGSKVEINGQYYSIDSNLAITGATVNDTWYDILLTPSGTGFTASYIARGTGAWSDSKQGLYSGNNRVVACVKRITVANFINKNILRVVNRTIEIKIEIGDWDMNTDPNKNVAHGLTLGNIRNVGVIIRNDANSAYYPIEQLDGGAGGGGKVSGGILQITATVVGITRAIGGQFDGVSFDTVPYNRGWTTITYEV